MLRKYATVSAWSSSVSKCSLSLQTDPGTLRKMQHMHKQQFYFLNMEST